MKDYLTIYKKKKEIKCNYFKNIIKKFYLIIAKFIKNRLLQIKILK